MGTFLSNMLSCVAENERTNIRRRLAEGIAAAKVECGMPLAAFRYRAEIYENAKFS